MGEAFYMNVFLKTIFVSFPPESDPLAGQSVNVGRDGLLVAVAAQARLQVVHHDQQDVGRGD